MKLDLASYTKKKKEETLIEKVSVPITPVMKARITKVRERFDINKAVRDHLEKILEQAEKAS